MPSASRPGGVLYTFRLRTSTHFKTANQKGFRATRSAQMLTRTTSNECVTPVKYCRRAKHRRFPCLPLNITPQLTHCRSTRDLPMHLYFYLRLSVAPNGTTTSTSAASKSTAMARAKITSQTFVPRTTRNTIKTQQRKRYNLNNGIRHT